SARTPATSRTCARSSGSIPRRKPEAADLTPFSRTAAGVLAAVFAFILLGRGLGDSYTVFLLPLERDFGWTRSQVASVYSIYLLVHGGTATLAGLVFDRLGPRGGGRPGWAGAGSPRWNGGFRRGGLGRGLGDRAVAVLPVHRRAG